MKPLAERLNSLKDHLLNKKNSNKRLSNIDYSIIIDDVELHDYLCSRYKVNRENITELLYCALTDELDSICECGDKKKFYRYSDGYHSSCGKNECINRNRTKNYKKTVRSKYGVDHASQLKSTIKTRENTMLTKYGIKHNWSGELRQTSENTMLGKYGVKHALQNKSLKEKRNATTIAKHGTLNMLGLDKTKSTNIAKYGYENASKNQEIIDKIKRANFKNSAEEASIKLAKFNISILKYVSKQQKYLLTCNKCGNTFESPGCSVNVRLRKGDDPCIYCNPTVRNTGTSTLELEVFEFIREIVPEQEVEFNNRTMVTGYELDMYFPKLKKAIEINGVYWHSEMEKSKNYHVDKNTAILNNGISIKHIWEDSWNLKKSIVKSMIMSWLNLTRKIYARNCGCYEIANSQAFSFCEENHLKGGKNTTISYGLFNNDELVAVMTFLKIKNDWILDRLCYKFGVSVIGGASKLFKHFVRSVNPKKISTWADCDLTPDPNNSVYSRLGFTCTKWTPSYSWVVSGVRVNRQQFTKTKLVKNGQSSAKTEVEIMHNNGFYRTFETGNWKFEWKASV